MEERERVSFPIFAAFGKNLPNDFTLNCTRADTQNDQKSFRLRLSKPRYEALLQNKKIVRRGINPEQENSAQMGSLNFTDHFNNGSSSTVDRPQQLNFAYLLNSGSSIDVLNEPNLAYEFPLSPHEDICDTRVHIDQEKSCNKKSQKQSIRTSNFSADEDRLLIFAWLNTSQDPIKGFEQKRNQFWKRVTEYYEKHKTWAGNERSEKSLTNRWSKISTQVSKFCGYYVGIDHLRKSGYTERDKVLEAKDVYKDKESILLYVTIVGQNLGFSRNG